MLGGSQQAVDYGNQGDVSLDRFEIPQLILVQPFVLAFLVIDFHGPAMAIDTGDPRRMPEQAVADQEEGGVRQIGLAIIDDQPVFSKVGIR